MGDTLVVILLIGLPLLGLVSGYVIRLVISRFLLTSSEQRAGKIIKESKREAENIKKEYLLEAKDEILNKKNSLEQEVQERRGEIQSLEKRLTQREENLDKRVEVLEKKESYLTNLEQDTKNREQLLQNKEHKLQQQLAHISGMTVAEAKKAVMTRAEEDARHDAVVLINRIEEDARRTAQKESREIVISAMQRTASNLTLEHSVTSVTIPNDEMKGRIIGREGRNIHALETITGVDIIIDDTPEIVVISSFDPVRREIARTSLERLILDGRIHPTRIEEVVKQVKEEVDSAILDEGEKALFDFGIQGINQEITIMLGKLKYRTSYGQNVMQHSREVAHLSGIIAAELDLDKQIAVRAGLLHDVGKAITVEGEGAHALVGMEFVKRFKENAVICNAVGAHHNEIEPLNPYSSVVQVADAISASRPGARRETLDNYIKRLEDLEKIAVSFNGVEKAYAIQAGREVRIIVNHELVNDDDTLVIARDIAKRIEEEMIYPGQVKVTLIREMRIVEYAR